MELVFERRGAGEPLLLLHPIGSRWQVFEPVLDLLTGEFEVWAVDMPGFGASPPATFVDRHADRRGAGVDAEKGS